MNTEPQNTEPNPTNQTEQKLLIGFAATLASVRRISENSTRQNAHVARRLVKATLAPITTSDFGNLTSDL
jgi:hypothetical protein